MSELRRRMKPYILLWVVYLAISPILGINEPCSNEGCNQNVNTATQPNNCMPDGTSNTQNYLQPFLNALTNPQQGARQLQPLYGGASVPGPPQNGVLSLLPETASNPSTFGQVQKSPTQSAQPIPIAQAQRQLFHFTPPSPPSLPIFGVNQQPQVQSPQLNFVPMQAQIPALNFVPAPPIIRPLVGSNQQIPLQNLQVPPVMSPRPFIGVNQQYPTNFIPPQSLQYAIVPSIPNLQNNIAPIVTAPPSLFDHYPPAKSVQYVVPQMPSLQPPVYQPPQSLQYNFQPPQGLQYNVQPPQSLLYNVQPPQGLQYNVQPSQSLLYNVQPPQSLQYNVQSPQSLPFNFQPLSSSRSQNDRNQTPQSQQLKGQPPSSARSLFDSNQPQQQQIPAANPASPSANLQTSFIPVAQNLMPYYFEPKTLIHLHPPPAGISGARDVAFNLPPEEEPFMVEPSAYVHKYPEQVQAHYALRYIPLIQWLRYLFPSLFYEYSKYI